MIGVDDAKITAISQFASSKNWQIQFNDDVAFNLAKGKTVNINNDPITLIDANDREDNIKNTVNKPVTMTVFLKVHWLPIGFKDKLVNFIEDEASFLTVHDAKAERWEAGKSPIENGILSVKVSYELIDHARLLEFAGLHKVGDQTALFQISGAPPKCLYCKLYGHMRKECPKLKTQCGKCGKVGHDENNCTLANRIASDNNAKSAGTEEDITIDDENDKNSSNPEIIATLPATASAMLAASELSGAKDQDSFKVPNGQAPTLEVKKEMLINFQPEKLSDPQLEKKAKDKAKREAKKTKMEEEAKEKAIKKAEAEGKKREDFLLEFEAMNAQAKREVLGKTISRKKSVKQPASSTVGGATSKIRSEATTDATTDADTDIELD